MIPADLDDVSVRAGQSVPITKTFKFIDKLSDDQKTEELCGKMKYKLIDADSLSFIELKTPPAGSSSDKVTILINAVDEITASVRTITVIGELEEFPFVAPGRATFTVEILATTQVEDEEEEAEVTEVIEQV